MKWILLIIFCSLLVLAWGTNRALEEQRECEARMCSPGKTAKLLSSGRYTVECVCVEVPQ